MFNDREEDWRKWKMITATFRSVFLTKRIFIDCNETNKVRKDLAVFLKVAMAYKEELLHLQLVLFVDQPY